MIKTVIFELDGVLADTHEWHCAALVKAIKEVTNSEVSGLVYGTVWSGMSNEEKLALLVEDELLKGHQVEEVSEKAQEYMLDIIKERINMDRSKCAMLGALTSDGIWIACVTGSTRKTAIAVLQGTYIQRYLNIVIAKEDVILPKPHPNGYWNAMALLGVVPEETLIVTYSGDAEAAHITGANVWEVSSPGEVTWRDLARQFELCEGA